MNQRARKKRWGRSEPSSGMTAGQAAKLQVLGFVGDLRVEAVWDSWLVWLVAYKAAHGDCNMPSGWAEELALARTWVNHQRAYTKKLDRGDPNPNITAAGAAKLDTLGFVWVT
jgi:hypothetical protein